MIQAYYGEGKGKTTAAIGQGIRAIGNHYKVIMIQFLKNDDTCEYEMLKQLEPDFKVFNFEKKRGFTWELNEEEKQELKSEVSNALKFATKVMDTGQCDVLILDEILNVIELELVTEAEVCALLDNKSEELELILTGRSLPEAIAQRADYISYIDNIKHPYDRGIEARKGIEY